jgi:steroid 5-alpha reductase family enzyme
VKLKFFVDTHKGATGLVVLALMGVYHAWDDGRAWLYLAMHGTYGVLWMTKSRFFGDKQWEKPVSLGFGLFTWTGMSMYWVSPWLIASRHTATPPAWWMGLCVFVFTVGIFLHYVSDMQKFMWLKLRPGALLTDGLWGRLRNPNYFGELLVYGGFSAVAYHWAPMLVMAMVIGGMWIPNMLRKDKSLSRYPEFAAYKARSSLFIPGVW